MWSKHVQERTNFQMTKLTFWNMKNLCSLSNELTNIPDDAFMSVSSFKFLDKWTTPLMGTKWYFSSASVPLDVSLSFIWRDKRKDMRKWDPWKVMECAWKEDKTKTTTKTAEALATKQTILEKQENYQRLKTEQSTFVFFISMQTLIMMILTTSNIDINRALSGIWLVVIARKR